MKIAIDIDEVLADLLQDLLDFHKEKHGHTKERSIFTGYHWEDHLPTLGHDIFKELMNNHPMRVTPIPGAKEVVSKMKDPIAVTARWRQYSQPTKQWIKEHFPNIKEIHHINCEIEGRLIEKGDLLKQLGCTLFIEDQLDYAKTALKLNIPVILMDAPWNQNYTHPLLTRVKSWQEIAKILESSQ